MRFLLVILVVLLVGCGGQPSLKELEAEALRTGDWSEVERRQRLRAMRRAGANACPEGFTRICTGPEIRASCACLDPSMLSGAGPSD